MRRMIGKILKCYGVSATGEGHPVRIFFQPSGSKSWQSMDPIVTPLGRIPGGQYLYIGPAEQEVRLEDTVVVGTGEYVVRRAEAYEDDQGPVYWWALCVKKGGADTW